MFILDKVFSLVTRYPKRFLIEEEEEEATEICHKQRL